MTVMSANLMSASTDRKARKALYNMRDRWNATIGVQALVSRLKYSTNSSGACVQRTISPTAIRSAGPARLIPPLLDGSDLGVGILLPPVQGEAIKDEMMNSVASDLARVDTPAVPRPARFTLMTSPMHRTCYKTRCKNHSLHISECKDI